MTWMPNGQMAGKDNRTTQAARCLAQKHPLFWAKRDPLIGCVCIFVIVLQTIVFYLLFQLLGLYICTYVTSYVHQQNATMSVRALKSFTWLWIASLLIATVGVSGQQIYCYCVGKTTLSFFVAEDACAAGLQHDRGSCCTASLRKVTRSCCTKVPQSDTSKGCTRKTTRVFQLKTAFLVQELGTEKVSDGISDQPILFLYQPLYAAFVYQSSKADFPVFEHPPPVSGRMICVRNGVFRC
jgi:hypothetical protein